MCEAVPVVVCLLSCVEGKCNLSFPIRPDAPLQQKIFQPPDARQFTPEYSSLLPIYESIVKATLFPIVRVFIVATVAVSTGVLRTSARDFQYTHRTFVGLSCNPPQALDIHPALSQAALPSTDARRSFLFGS